MRKVLILAYHYPPSDAVGALRPASFAELLPEGGWSPIVLTAGNQADSNVAQFGTAPAGLVESASAWPGLRDVWRRVHSLVGRGTAGRDLDPAAESAWADEFARDRVRGGIKVALQQFAYSLMSLPDVCHGWIPPAVLGALSLARRELPDAILVTSPPHSAQVAGLVASQLTGIPLVADFRDPWVGNEAAPAYLRESSTQGAHRWLEAQVVSQARAVVAATSQHAREIRERYPAARDRVTCIPNGFDCDAFHGLTSGGTSRFTITYAGNFYHTRTPEPLFAALRVLMDEESLQPNEIEVRLLGDCEYVGGRSVRALAREAGLSDSVVVVGRRPHAEALAELVGSDLLLLLAASQPQQIPTKTYEYLAAGPPILALVEPGSTAELLEGADADVLYDHGERAVASALRRRFESWTPRRPRNWTCPPGATPYARSRAAGAMGRLLDAVGGGA